ncbi:MAG: APC family permease [Anaerolineae bacterium]|nr:APC family permease [Anaerolineae bacterium]MCB9459393.1 APC family permease [Anaerolineaceae bacterium]
MYDLNIRRLLIGKPLKTNDAIHQRLNKAKALAVFSSDALSSSAYATEAILLVLVAAGTGALGISMPISLLITSLLLIVAFSYYQTIHAYPNGGGAYIVSKDNLGALPGLTAAASLLIDYILTVAVSVSAGVAALTSAFPELLSYRIILALAIVAFVTVMNLRGVKESGTFFAIPTYAFIVGVFTLIGFGLFRVLTGTIPEMSPEAVVAAEQTSETAIGSLGLFLLLRAFAAGCTALTGVEAISNGIPAFRPPESRNAGQTLIIMVTVLSSLFVGITFLANTFPIVVSEHGDSTVLSQLAREVFGGENLLFYYLQFATLFILSLAANTAFADFPRLASLIAADRYLPRQLTNIGDRLVFHNGIISLAVISSILIIIFDAREHRLLPLYAVGVFISFTLSQSGMVRHWLRERAKPNFKGGASWYFKIFMNAFGAVATFIVMLILMITKFAEGAWIVIIAIPTLMFIFTRIHKHYGTVAESLTLEGLTPGPLKRVTSHVVNQPVVVLMNSLNRCSLQALEYALTLSENVRVCTIGVDDETVDRLQKRWEEWDLGYIPLDIVESPYREVGTPLIEYLHQLDKEAPHVMPTMVVLPQFVVSTWWENLMHNQTSNTIRDSLMRDQIATGRGRAVIDVPYHIGGKLFQPVTQVVENTAKSTVAPVSN